MNTRLATDPELLDLVRRADPMRDPRVQASAGLDTESALRLLALELDRPPAPRRRSALRTAVLVGAVAAAVFVVANIASTGNRSAVSPALAQTILRHVRDALAWPPHAIYEEEDTGTVTARDGARFTSASHEWLSTRPPYNMRLIRSWNGKVQWEQEFINHRLDLYDPRTNTVYLGPAVAKGPGPCTPRSRTGCQTFDQPQWNSALSEVQYLLNQPNVTVNPHAMLDGKPAIKLTSDGGRFSYWISPGSYQPLQSVDHQDSLPDGQRGVGIDRYPVARVLTGSAASPSLLSLKAQLPHATIDHSSTHYQAALWRVDHVDGLLRRCSRSGCS
jgi:hypothetical protein